MQMCQQLWNVSREAGFPTGILYASDFTLDNDPDDDIPLIDEQTKKFRWKFGQSNWSFLYIVV